MRTAKRVQQAGLVAMLGGVALIGSFLGLEAIEVQGRLPLASDPEHIAYYLSNVSLLIGWGGLFVGVLGLRAQQAGLYGRHWKAGIALAGIGFGVVTIGFVIQVAAPLVGLVALIDIGGMLSGIGLLFSAVLGSLVLGSALLRANAVPRLGALLIMAEVLTIPVVIVFEQSLYPLLGVMLFIGPLAAAWVVIGYDLWSSTDETIREMSPMSDEEARIG